MTRSVLEYAKTLMRRRKFGSAIALLRQYHDSYKGTFEYYLMLGTSCLYVGDVGNAMHNYELAREIKITNSELLLGQAVIFLRKGETDRALHYYLDILSFDPNNTIVKDALEFIREHGDYKTICEWAESGRLMRFYPPLGMNPDVVRNCIFAGFLLGAFISIALVICLNGKGITFNKAQKQTDLESKNLQRLELTEEEILNARDISLSSDDVHFYLSGDDINKSYQLALKYVKQERDNAARVEINRIISSTANSSIKRKAEDLLVLLKEPGFDNFKDNFSYYNVLNDVTLYKGCYVIWDGKIANMQLFEDNSLKFDLLEGYVDSTIRLEGIVPVTFKQAPTPPLDSLKPIRVLGVVCDIEGKPALEVKSFYQPLKGDVLPPLIKDQVAK